jgi:aminopeptidase N
MLRRLLLVAVLAAFVPVPAVAQSSIEAVTTGRDSRSHDYDLIHQRIALRDFSWDSSSFRGEVEVTLRALQPGFDSVILDAGRLLTIDSVRALTRATPRPGVRRARAAAGPVLGPALAWTRSGDTLVVRLPTPLALGDTARFLIGYHGRAEGGHGLRFFEEDRFTPARPRQLWSQGQAMENHHWFPTYDFPNDPMTWELLATVPRELQVISNGLLVRNEVGRDGLRTVHWYLDQPAVTYLVSIVVAPLVRFAERWRGVLLEYNVYPSLADSARVRIAFGDTPDIMRVFSGLTGVPYPWKRYAQTTVTEHFGGMENVTASTLADWIPDSTALLDRPWYRHLLVPHELAHMWFGDWVTTADWAHMWLNEGFAQFMPARYWAVRQGPRVAEEYHLDDYQNYLRQDRRRRMPLASLGSNVIYPKGSLVLEMLRNELGDARFWAAVRRYLEKQRDQGATSDDFRQAILHTTGENLAWFWAQWVYRAGHPDFTLSADWDSAQAVLKFTVRQTQRDTLAPDSTGLRYEVPEVFRGRVRVRVGTAHGDRTVEAALTAREQVIEVPGVTSAPEFVIFDEGNRLLKTVTFPQPTAWLARQLERDPTLWNREWVIDELAARRPDSLALAALAKAAVRADYAATRRAAVEALAGWGAPASRAALLAALADTSAQVRAAAAAALGSESGDTVRMALRRLWREERSYAVRAAVVGSLARVDSADASALLGEALATPSYLDQIGSAALAAIVARNDTALAGPVADAIGRVPGAEEALFALAVRARGGALERLFTAAVSPDAGIRHRVLAVFGRLSPEERRAVRDLLDKRTSDPAVKQDLERLSGQ